jgi:3-oxoacyl-[acyl-carrier protein] reductase
MSARSILITGANGGLGVAIAEAFVNEAASNRVWLGVRSNRSNCDALAARFPNQCQVVELEVTKPESWQTALKQVLDVTGRIDVLVNNAGQHQDGLLATMSPSAWSDVLSAHLDGAFHGCQSVLPAMISQRSGRIINISSLSALLAPAGQTNYAAAKAGLIGLTQSLAKEVARIGITVNAICPGYINTGAIAGFDDQQKQQALARVPMRRFGEPREVAAAVRFLACPEASYITGSILKVDGGVL